MVVCVYPGIPLVSPRPMAAQHLPRSEGAGLDDQQGGFLQRGRALGWGWAWLQALSHSQTETENNQLQPVTATNANANVNANAAV